MAQAALHHKVVVVGGGTAGITVAARLKRAGEQDVAIVEPSDKHFYQPLWTLVGAGEVAAEKTVRAEASVMPRGVRWVQDRTVAIDPDERVVATENGVKVAYDHLVVAPGIQLDWEDVGGLGRSIGHNGVSSNYRFDLAPKTWEFLRRVRSGTILFTQPDSPIKCGGAPQKIMYLAADNLRRQGLLDKVRIIFLTPGDGIFGVPEFARVLEDVIDRYGIEVRYGNELVEVNGDAREATVQVRGSDGESHRDTIAYDFMHVVPPQSAPDFLKKSPVAMDDPRGWVDVDKHTLQHVRYPEVFALGDASGSPNSKTGAAVRKQAPVVVENLMATMEGRQPTAQYDGYSSCPLLTAHGKMLLAEFDYSGRPHPTIPLINTQKERWDMWMLKKYGLPMLYWNGMLRGLA